jgi:hypothetical protein
MEEAEVHAQMVEVVAGAMADAQKGRCENCLCRETSILPF